MVWGFSVGVVAGAGLAIFANWTDWTEHSYRNTVELPALILVVQRFSGQFWE